MTHPLFTAQARTANGASTNSTSGSRVLDFFSICAASRGKDIKDVFNAALSENRELALRALLWLRDVRGGAGERDQFRTLFATLSVADQLRLYSVVPEVGRWDDLLTAVDVLSVRNFILFSLLEQGNGLAAKWMPRQGPVAGKLRKTVNMSAKDWRKLLVGLSNTVEQKMSAGNWGEINFSHVPSCASNLYRKAFNKRDADRYQEYLSAVEKGEAKINASAIYPHDIVKSAMEMGGSRTAELQWKALPDYIGDNQSTFLPVVDVSGSMQSAQVLNHAVALGIYLAERNKSVFKDHIISFSGDPHFHHIGTGTLAEKVQKVRRSGEDMSTNIQGVFDRLLTRAKELKLSQADMPSHLLILSDMEFNSAGGWEAYDGGYGRRNRSEKTNYQTVVDKFRAAGYEVPTLVFWNLYARPGNSPVTTDDYGTVMVSGFSPAIMKTVLSAKVVSPYDVMLEVLMNSRYDLGKLYDNE